MGDRHRTGPTGTPGHEWCQCWTAYLFFSKSTQGVLTPLEYTAVAGLIAAVVNTPLTLLVGQDLSWPSRHDWVVLAAMGFGSGVLAHLLMNWSSTRIPVGVGSAMTVLIPVGATVMARVVLDEPIALVQGVGMALPLLALVAITRSQ